MAMYEDKGYCPCNEFAQYGAGTFPNVEEKIIVSPLWKNAVEILGDRIGYMVYSEAGTSYRDFWCHIVDAMKGATGTLGIQIASVLAALIPNCKYNENGRPIVCTDIINPYAICKSLEEQDGKWSFKKGWESHGILLLQDERYLVAIQDKDQEVQIKLYRK